jgi:hypothetical protein
MISEMTAPDTAPTIAFPKHERLDKARTRSDEATGRPAKGRCPTEPPPRTKHRRIVHPEPASAAKVAEIVWADDRSPQ